jgi:hypothetical protein
MVLAHRSAEDNHVLQHNTQRFSGVLSVDGCIDSRSRNDHNDDHNDSFNNNDNYNYRNNDDHADDRNHTNFNQRHTLSQ